MRRRHLTSVLFALAFFGVLGAMAGLSAHSGAQASPATIPAPWRSYLPLIFKYYPSRPTPTPTPTPSSTPTPAPLYFDDFGDSNSGWPVGDDEFLGIDYEGGNYRVRIKQDHTAVFSTSGFACADCVIEVDAWRSGGDDSHYGVLLGLSGNPLTFYTFIVEPTQQEYALIRLDENDWTVIVPATPSTHIIPHDGRNRLKVLRLESWFELYVNDHYLGSWWDDRYRGVLLVGIYGASFRVAPVTLRYDNFTVWDVGTRAGSDRVAVSGFSGTTGAFEFDLGRPVLPQTTRLPQ